MKDDSMAREEIVEVQVNVIRRLVFAPSGRYLERKSVSRWCRVDHSKIELFFRFVATSRWVVAGRNNWARWVDVGRSSLAVRCFLVDDFHRSKVQSSRRRPDECWELVRFSRCHCEWGPTSVWFHTTRHTTTNFSSSLFDRRHGFDGRSSSDRGRSETSFYFFSFVFHRRKRELIERWSPRQSATTAQLCLDIDQNRWCKTSTDGNQWCWWCHRLRWNFDLSLPRVQSVCFLAKKVRASSRTIVHLVRWWFLSRSSRPDEGYIHSLCDELTFVWCSSRGTEIIQRISSFSRKKIVRCSCRTFRFERQMTNSLSLCSASRRTRRTRVIRSDSTTRTYV